MNGKIINADVIQGLKEIKTESIYCVVTSPPYWGLRDYGVNGQIGLEETPEKYVDKLVNIFREVKRVLRNDGTVWLNLGDSYAGSGKGRNADGTANIKAGTISKQSKGQMSGILKKLRFDKYNSGTPNSIQVSHDTTKASYTGLKLKDLIGIPWRVAFALQTDGFYLRQDIIWHKPNPMPESVVDRCTKAHEYIFLLSKSSKYYFDHEAMKEPAVQNRWGKKKQGNLKTSKGDYRGLNRERDMMSEVRNKRSVWTVATKPFIGAHFATFPEALIEPMILAGCPKNGTVLDPFFGAGTVGVVCKKNNRNFIGIEINPNYCKIAEERISRSFQSTLMMYASR